MDQAVHEWFNPGRKLCAGHERDNRNLVSVKGPLTDQPCQHSLSPSNIQAIDNKQNFHDKIRLKVFSYDVIIAATSNLAARPSGMLDGWRDAHSSIAAANARGVPS